MGENLPADTPNAPDIVSGSGSQGGNGSLPSSAFQSRVGSPLQPEAISTSWTRVNYAGKSEAGSERQSRAGSIQQSPTGSARQSQAGSARQSRASSPRIARTKPLVASELFVLPDPDFDARDNEFILQRRARKDAESVLLGIDGIEDSLEDEVEQTIREWKRVTGGNMTNEMREKMTNNIKSIRSGGWLESVKASIAKRTKVPVTVFSRLATEHETLLGDAAEVRRRAQEQRIQDEREIRRLRQELAAAQASAKNAGETQTHDAPANEEPANEPENSEPLAPTRAERNEFNEARRVFWGVVEDTRRAMGDLEQQAVELYRAFGFTDAVGSGGEALDRIAAQVRAHPNPESQLRLYAAQATIDRNVLRARLETEQLRSRQRQTQQKQGTTSAVQAERESRMRYGIFNEDELARRLDADTQAYRLQRRDLLDTLVAARDAVARAADRCGPDVAADLRRVRDDHLDITRLRAPRPQQPRQPRQPGVGWA
ncbi:hypothetical protein GGR52DRAFT_114706 [Hypoxylon sp. FL1284]|nr:hypothetical protein GGR52DRAFT_114706 [Hypoxylon sp. FL1284]